MPKSRNRGRVTSRQTQPRRRQRKWTKWLGLLLPLALLLGTLAGIFGVGSSAAAVPVPSAPISGAAGR